MLKVLIVDDEHMIRKGLTKIIQREEGFIVVGEASNGKEALAIIEKEKPHVVVTDVKMPHMDGMELIKVLDKTYPNIKKIVLSGFDEYNFVRETLTNGALDYLLKPIDNQQLMGILKEVAQKLSVEDQQKKIELSREINYKESISAFVNQLLTEILTSTQEKAAASYQKLVELSKDYDLLGQGPVRLVTIRLDNYFVFDKQGLLDSSLLMNNITSCIEYTFRDGCSYLPCILQNYQVVILMDQSLESTKELVQRLYENTERTLENSVTIGISAQAHQLSDLGSAWKQVKGFLESKLSKNGSSVYLIENTNEPSGSADIKEITNLVEKYYPRLKSGFETGNIHHISTVISEVFEKVSHSDFSKQDMIKLFTDMHTRVSISFSDFDRWIQDLYGSNYSFIGIIQLFDTLDAMVEFILGFYTEIANKASSTKSRKDTRMIEVVKDYVNNHYKQNITLNKIAEITYVNPNYFCEVFKSEMNMTFIDYLTHVRIEKAKALLKDLSVKVYEVSGLVGYEDATYFSKVFKKHVGVTPSQYRDM